MSCQVVESSSATVPKEKIPALASRKSTRVGHRVDLRGDVAERHVGAFARELQRVRTALAAGAPGDQYDLPVEPSHVLLLERC
jgi:hypothetical protein